MRFLIAVTVVLALAGLLGVWFSARHRKPLVAVSLVALVASATLVVGMIGFPRETCELMGGNLTGYDSGPCVNEFGGTSAGGIGS